MARIRSVHPKLLTDEAVMRLTLDCPIAVVLVIGLWTEADDAGVFEWKPLTLKARILPVAPVAIDDLLALLAQLNFIKRFDVEGRPFGVIRNFVKYQRQRRPCDVHPFTPEMRAFAGFESGKRPRLGAREAEEGDDLFEPAGSGAASDAPAQAEPRRTMSVMAPVKEEPRRTMSVMACQRSEVGGKRESEEIDSVVVVSFPQAAKKPQPENNNNDDDLFEKFSHALGSKARPHIVKRLVRELRPSIEEGCDLDVDVLPELKEIRAKLSGSLSPGMFGRIIAQVRDRRDGRLAAQKAHAARPRMFFVEADTAPWRAWVAAGHKPGLNYAHAVVGGRKVAGWEFESEWPPGSAREATA